MSEESDWKRGLLKYIGKVFGKKVLKSLISTPYVQNLNDEEDKSGCTSFIGTCNEGH